MLSQSKKAQAFRPEEVKACAFLVHYNRGFMALGAKPAYHAKNAYHPKDVYNAYKFYYIYAILGNAILAFKNTYVTCKF